MKKFQKLILLTFMILPTKYSHVENLKYSCLLFTNYVKENKSSAKLVFLSKPQNIHVTYYVAKERDCKSVEKFNPFKNSRDYIIPE